MTLKSERKNFGRSGVALLLATLTLSSAMVSWSAEPNWLDIESQIQYAYYTEDLHALRNLVAPLAASAAQGGLKSYYQGLLAYRITELSRGEADRDAAAPQDKSQGKTPAPARKNDRTKNEARQTVEHCVTHLDAALEAQSDFADALALQSACLSLEADLSTWRAPFAQPKSLSEIHKALQWAPKNPRVLLLDAIVDYEHESTPPADPERPCEKFKVAAAVFEQERAAVDKVPGWGSAEAYTWLGRCYLDKQDAVAARDALERALLIAPEFTRARRLIAAITSG